jgi:hypothetical protein
LELAIALVVTSKSILLTAVGSTATDTPSSKLRLGVVAHDVKKLIKRIITTDLLII